MGQAKKKTNGMLQVQKIRKFFARYLISCDIKKKQHNPACKRHVYSNYNIQQINTLPIEVPDREEQVAVSESEHQQLKQLLILWHIQEEHTICIYVPWKNVNLRDSWDLCSSGSQNKGLMLEAWQV